MAEQTENTTSKKTGPKNYISYAQILQDRENFRASGGRFGSDFNRFDTPSQKYFKLFFYFSNGTDHLSNKDMEMTGLLAPVWYLDLKEEEWHLFTNAWTYLKMNYEDERAALLENFITLLSNINSESPWYFSEIGGLDSAINRKYVMEEKMTIENKRSKISIKCLPDAFDDRIGTLLDLYRTIVWSWTNKREILPANFRKFDMGILVFETPTTPFHQKWNKELNYITDENQYLSPLSDLQEDFSEMNWESHYLTDFDKNKSSFKFYELHNCEIDYNSTIGLNQLNNKEGVTPEYTIDIHFDDCYEVRYNEFLMKELGDFIMADTSSVTSGSTRIRSRTKNYENKQSQIIKDKTNHYFKTDNKPVMKDQKYVNKRLPGFPELKVKSGLLAQVAGTAKGMVNSFVNKLLLGNLYTFSLSRMGNQLKDVAKGNVFNVARNANEYYTDYKQRKENDITMNLFGTPKKRILPTVKKIGNIAQANTIANNT